MNTKLGRFHVAEPLTALATLHHHDGSDLRTADHEPKLAVLDQEDLLAQGIDTSELIPGAARVDALGSCVFNATTAHLSNILGQTRFEELTGAGSYSDTVPAEEYAIRLYHATTDLTGDPASEWPPTDCGSSGIFVCKELQQQGVIGLFKTAHGPENIISLLQHQSAIIGTPWFNSWFTPDPGGFIDGNGTVRDLDNAIMSGVAGGHETHISAVEKLTVDEVGRVDASRTVLRVRNSWSDSWGDHGSYRVHLSTWVMLAGHIDVRQMVA